MFDPLGFMGTFRIMEMRSTTLEKTWSKLIHFQVCATACAWSLHLATRFEYGASGFRIQILASMSQKPSRCRHLSVYVHVGSEHAVLYPEYLPSSAPEVTGLMAWHTYTFKVQAPSDSRGFRSSFFLRGAAGGVHEFVVRSWGPLLSKNSRCKI